MDFPLEGGIQFLNMSPSTINTIKKRAAFALTAKKLSVDPSMDANYELIRDSMLRNLDLVGVTADIKIDKEYLCTTAQYLEKPNYRRAVNVKLLKLDNDTNYLTEEIPSSDLSVLALTSSSDLSSIADFFSSDEPQILISQANAQREAAAEDEAFQQTFADDSTEPVNRSTAQASGFRQPLPFVDALVGVEDEDAPEEYNFGGPIASEEAKLAVNICVKNFEYTYSQYYRTVFSPLFNPPSIFSMWSDGDQSLQTTQKYDFFCQMSKSLYGSFYDFIMLGLRRINKTMDNVDPFELNIIKYKAFNDAFKMVVKEIERLQADNITYKNAVLADRRQRNGGQLNLSEQQKRQYIEVTDEQSRIIKLTFEQLSRE